MTVTLITLPFVSNQTVAQSGGSLPDGGREVNVTFLATAEANKTTVKCTVTNRTQSSHFDTANALLLVQGKWFNKNDYYVIFKFISRSPCWCE